MPNHEPTTSTAGRDEADLAQFGYKQELKRSLGLFSSFAVAFSYISPSTGHLHPVLPGPDDHRRASCSGRGRSSPWVSSSWR